MCSKLLVPISNARVELGVEVIVRGVQGQIALGQPAGRAPRMDFVLGATSVRTLGAASGELHLAAKPSRGPFAGIQQPPVKRFIRLCRECHAGPFVEPNAEVDSWHVTKHALAPHAELCAVRHETRSEYAFMCIHMDMLTGHTGGYSKEIKSRRPMFQDTGGSKVAVRTWLFGTRRE